MKNMVDEIYEKGMGVVKILSKPVRASTNAVRALFKAAAPSVYYRRKKNTSWGHTVSRSIDGFPF